MSKFDAMAGIGPQLTRRPLVTIGEGTKSTNDPVMNYGTSSPPDSEFSPNTAYRAPKAPAYGKNVQTTADPKRRATNTGKPYQKGTK